MKVLVDYMRLILFVGGALIGVQIPSFVDQYGQRLDAHLMESKTAINEFQNDADKYFGGDVNKLVQHYLRNEDPVFNDGGESIEALAGRYRLLKDSVAAFNAQIYSPFLQTLIAPVTEIRNKAWESYDYAIKLNAVGIAWALAIGFMLALIIDLLLKFCRYLFSIKHQKSDNREPVRTTPPEI